MEEVLLIMAVFAVPAMVGIGVAWRRTRRREPRRTLGGNVLSVVISAFIAGLITALFGLAVSTALAGELTPASLMGLQVLAIGSAALAALSHMVILAWRNKPRKYVEDYFDDR